MPEENIDEGTSEIGIFVDCRCCSAFLVCCVYTETSHLVKDLKNFFILNEIRLLVEDAPLFPSRQDALGPGRQPDV